MANRWFTQFYGSLHKKPVQLDCNFVVDPTNQNGLGIRSLKGPGIGNVFMRTTASMVADTHTNLVLDNIVGGTANLVVGTILSGTGIQAGTKIASITSGTAITVTKATTATNAGVTVSIVADGSPNPAAGLVVVNLQDNFPRLFFGVDGFVSPNSGTSITIVTGASLTIGRAYVITSVGTTTVAQWNAVGVPVGITPAVGVAFIAKATSGTGSGTVQIPSTSGVSSVEMVGNPDTTLTSAAPTVLGLSSGSYLIAQFVDTRTIALTGATNTNTTLNAITPGTFGLLPGQEISGAGIPLGTTIASINSNVALTLSAAATASATIPFTVAGRVAVAPNAGSTVQLALFLSNSLITVQGE